MKQALSGLNLALLTVIGGPLLVAEIALAEPQSETAPLEPIPELTDQGDATVNEIGEDGESAPPTAISAVSEPPPATTVAEWQAQIEAALVQITGIRLEATEAGLQVVIEADGNLVTPTQSVSGNALVLEIPNAVLVEPVQEFEPAEGIALVQASALPGDIVQVAITGSDAVPVVNITAEAAGLVLGITPGVAQVGADNDAIQLVVTGEEDGYVVPNATTATRTDTPLRDIPQSIQVIPQEVLEDQQVIRLNDALRNVSGVVSSAADPRGQRFIVRGFDGATVLRNGIQLTPGGGNFGFQELSNIERIEVLKGPASILFGNVQPGGAINLVTEQPLSEPFYEVNFRTGNRNLFEGGIDLSGPLSEDGKLLYRLNALYRTEAYHRDFDVPIERFFITPVISWAITDNTDLTVSLEYDDSRRPADFGGLPAIGDRIAEVPFNRITGESGDEATNETLRIGYDFEHRFSDNWRIRNTFSYYRFEPVFTANVAAQAIGNPADGNFARVYFKTRQLSQTTALQTSVVGEFSTGSIEHTLLAGVDLGWRRFEQSGLQGTPQFPFFNIFNPVYGVPQPASFSGPLTPTNDSYEEFYGAYVQDQIQLAENLHLLAGLRYDIVTNETRVLTAGTTTARRDTAFSPRLGVVYQPIEPLSLYASYSRSFAPNGGTTATGEFLEPERGQQFEVGARAELLGGRLVANLALFDITKQNVATADPNPLNVGASVAAGEQRSRGIELDVIGEILPGWNVVANYAYTDATITESNDTVNPEGNRLFGVPEHNVNLWTTYEIQEGDLAGLGFGLGVNYVGDRFGDNANSFVLEDYFLTNAAIFYERNDWNFALNIRNLFNVQYIGSSEGSRLIENRPGEGFTIIGSVSVEF